MSVRIGINGFGRIGRQSLKAILERAPELEVVAVNDLIDTSMNALLFKHDSTYGAYPGTVDHTDDALIIDGREIKVLTEKDPATLPWGDLGVDIVLESTGIFTDAEKARAHLTAGAKKVIISAPAKGEDITIVLGVNDDRYDPDKHDIISNASCTTNCLAPAAKVVHDLVGIERALMGGRPEHHPDQYWRREGAGPRDPGPEGQVRRLQPPRPDADRERRRLHGRRLAPDDRGGAQRGVRGSGRGADEGDPRRQRRTARLDGLPRRCTLGDHRR